MKLINDLIKNINEIKNDIAVAEKKYKNALTNKEYNEANEEITELRRRLRLAAEDLLAATKYMNF